MRLLTFNQYVSLNESVEPAVISKQFLLDGASSAGKSSALTQLGDDWCILAVDSFYNVMFEELGMEDFGNRDKPTISQIYPECPYKYTSPEDYPNYDKAARWYMAQEVMYGKIFETGLKDAEGKLFGKPKELDKIIYDDVEGTIIDMVKGTRPTWVLVHAPIDHTINNVKRRGDRPLDGVLLKSYCFKYEARPQEGGVDPTKSWNKKSIEDLLPGESWSEKFLTELGITDPEVEYWIWAKDQPQGKYDVVINTRSNDGGQKSIEDIGKEAAQIFN
jgi:hypothetical protein